MALLPSAIFQPPFPPIILLIPPSSRLQWLLRILLLCFTISTFPLICILVPISVVLPAKIAPLPLHPHNRPPHASFAVAVFRGLLVYCLGGMVWAITSTGCAPENGERETRRLSRGVAWFVELAAWITGSTSTSTNGGDVAHMDQHKSASAKRVKRGRKQSQLKYESGDYGCNEKNGQQQKRCVPPESPIYFNTGQTNRSHGPLTLAEEEMEPFPIEACRGVLAEAGLDRSPVVGFWLDHVSTSPSTTNPPPHETHVVRPPTRLSHEHRRVFLFLAGGGYVTGFPLVHPFIFSLLRSFPPSSTIYAADRTRSQVELPQYAVLAPHIRKSLSLDRAFPIPLLDALAGYAHLRKIGYEAEEVVVVGDSAGGGLAWSLMAYLAALQEDTGASSLTSMGVPGSVVLISPWLSLPPNASSPYLDLIDEPQLLNAARCYLSRFPILKHRPDPFRSDLHLWLEVASTRIDAFSAVLKRFIPARRGIFGRSHGKAEQMIEQKILHPIERLTPPGSHIDWLNTPIFEQMTSHHPFVSPASDLSSPFVNHTFELLARDHTRMYVHVGTAEWFNAPAIAFANTAKSAGVDVTVQEEMGGFHIEGCLLPGELGGMSGRLVKGLRKWILEA